MKRGLSFDSIENCLRQLGWDKAELVRQAGISFHTAAKAVNGGVISLRVARDIAEAFSKALGETVRVGDIEGLRME